MRSSHLAALRISRCIHGVAKGVERGIRSGDCTKSRFVRLRWAGLAEGAQDKRL